MLMWFRIRHVCVSWCPGYFIWHHLMPSLFLLFISLILTCGCSVAICVRELCTVPVLRIRVNADSGRIHGIDGRKFRNRKPPCLCILCHCCWCFYFSCSHLCVYSSYLRRVNRYQYCGSASMRIRSAPWIWCLKLKKFTGPAPKLRTNGCGKEAELRRPESPWTLSRFVIWSVLFTLSYCIGYYG